MQSANPLSPDELLQALARLEASSAFSRADRARRLLCHLIQLAAEGRTGEIKESTLAIDVFGRMSYDPKTNSLVRVEMAKLRTLLERYYASEGAADAIRVHVPKGRYGIEFHTAATAAAENAAPTSLSSRWWRGRWAVAALALAVVAAIAGIAIAARQRSPGNPAGPLIMALLPWETSGPPIAHELAEALRDELAVALGRLDNTTLSLAPLTLEQARSLGVQAAVAGSVRLEGRQARLIVRLLDVRDGSQVWSEAFDRPFEVPVALAREVAAEVTQVARMDLTEVWRMLALPRTCSPDAWRLLLRGVALLDTSQVLEASELLRAATLADRKCALAWAELSRSYATAADWALQPGDSSLTLASEAARRAVALDPQLGEAHQAQARAAALLLRDLDRAEKSFLRAIELDPTNASIRHEYARLVLSPLDRRAEAIDQLSRAAALAPNRREPHLELAGIHIRSRDVERARKHLEAAALISRGGPALCVLRGRLHLTQGELPQAIGEFRAAAAILENGWTLSHLAYALARSGNRQEAEKLEARIRQLAPDAFYSLAVVKSALGRRSEAVNLLAEARRARDPQLVWLRVDPRMAELRNMTGNERVGDSVPD